MQKVVWRVLPLLVLRRSLDCRIPKSWPHDQSGKFCTALCAGAAHLDADGANTEGYWICVQRRALPDARHYQPGSLTQT